MDAATLVHVNLTHDEQRLDMQLQCMLTLLCDEVVIHHVEVAGVSEGFVVWKRWVDEDESPTAGRHASLLLELLRCELSCGPRTASDALDVMCRRWTWE